MMKRFILAALLFLLLINAAVCSSAMQRESSHLLKSPGISEKHPNLSAQNQAVQKQENEEVNTRSLKNGKIGPVLNNFLAGKGNSSLTKTGSNKDMIRLIINTTGNKTPVYNAFNEHGARILNKHNGLMAIEVPVENVEKLVNETDAIKAARFPARLFPLAVKSEVLTDANSLFGAEKFHNLRYTGDGVKVAVMDVGFKGLNNAQSNGDIPDNIKTYDFTKNGLQTEYYHGTACAEIIYDMAPGAELYLLKVADEIDIYSAIDYCIDNEIDIISFSLGASGTGPGDGTGYMDECFDMATDTGILTVAAAGNYANFSVYGGHWEGVFNPDSDDIDRHLFIQGDQTTYYNVIGAYPSQNDDNEPVTGEVSIMMRWNDYWGDASVDYDIYLYEYDYVNDVILNPDSPVGFSTVTQNGNPDVSQYPIEQIYIDLLGSEDYTSYYYALVIKKKEGEDVLTDMEIYLGGTSTFRPFGSFSSAVATSESSVTEPADVDRVLAVGAIFYDDWQNGPKEEFSSQGPTNAWAGKTARIKPDISGPDGVSTYTFGTEGFFGTSASAPHVAGAAALLLSVYPGMSPEELKSFLETNAIDMGDAGNDNLYGYGKLYLPSDNIEPNEDEDDSDKGGGGGGGCFISTLAHGL
ncbi:MAG: S8 family serine peptidase [Deltaproteobacteria bacterium]|nr:S8 family serine peptidase [Deltaproteobacteria bacterium]